MKAKKFWIFGLTCSLVVFCYGAKRTRFFGVLSKTNVMFLSRPTKVQSSITESTQATQKWREQVLGSKVDLSAVEFLNPMHGWLRSDDSFYKTVDRGKTWKQVVIDGTSGSYLTAMTFVSDSIGWVALQKAVAKDQERENKVWLEFTSDGGNSWEKQYAGDAVIINKIRFTNTQEGWAVGRRALKDSAWESSLLVLHTENQGRDWSDISERVNRAIARSEHGVQDFATDVYAIEDHKATLLTVRGRLLITDDGGRSWREFGGIPNEPAQTYMARLGYATNKRLWILGGTDSREGMWGILAQNETGSWTVFRTDVHLKDAVYFSDTQVLACGSAVPTKRETPWNEKRDGVVLYSSDGGRHWTVIYRNMKVQSINALARIDSDNIVAVGDDGLVVKLDSY